MICLSKTRFFQTGYVSNFCVVDAAVVVVVVVVLLLLRKNHVVKIVM